MANNSKIEWTESTWNPITGCTKISPGCKHCYAERLALRLKAMGQPNYKNGFAVTLHDQAVELPLKWKQPQTIFVNSMSDIFHEEVPIPFIQKVFDIMEKSPQHRFQVLTKRSERMLEIHHLLNWSDNIWIGVSVESDDYLYRIDHLRQIGAKIKFLSLEPLLGPIPNMNLYEINWVIAGGESGTGSRPMQLDWVRDIREQCIHNKIPFFFKQWGGVNKKKAGRLLDGLTWDQMPYAV